MGAIGRAELHATAARLGGHLHAATPLMIFLGLLHKAVRGAAVSDLGEGRATSKFYILILQLVG